jgi:hypothetical protein
MTGYLRFCFASIVLLAGLSTSPGSSNPFAALFNAAPAQANAPAPAEPECIPRPGKSTADGQHWVYRLEGHRKCWFQAAAGSATVKKPHRVAKNRVATSEENETAVLRFAPAETSHPTSPPPALTVVDAGPVPGTETATLVLPAPVPNGANDQLTPDHATPRQIDVKTLLAAGSVATQVVAASAPSATPVAFPTAEASDDGRGWTWLGVLLMALGLVSVLGSSRIRWAALLHELK